jgi:hypothetical protein
MEEVYGHQGCKDVMGGDLLGVLWIPESGRVYLSVHYSRRKDFHLNMMRSWKRPYIYQQE